MSYPPMLTAFIDKLDPTLDVFPSEVYAAQIEEVLRTWSSSLAIAIGDLSKIERALAESLTASSFELSHVVPLRTAGALGIERRSFAVEAIVSREKFLKDFADSLSAWQTLQTVELEIYGIRVTAQSPLQVETDIRYDLVGTTQDGAREERVGEWTLGWARPSAANPADAANAADNWQVQSWRAHSETRSYLSGPGFTDVTGHCLSADSAGLAQLLPGIDHWRTAIDGASGIDVYGNHGIAVGDIDGSGFDSFYVCQPSGLPNRLYRNRGDGTFEDITKASGTGLLDGTASALFADFQNRGKQDLLVVRTNGPLLLNNMGNNRFEPNHEAFQFARPPQGTFTSAAVGDYDRDGFLDVYFCVYSYYQGLNQYQFPSPYYDAQNGPPNFLFRNRRDGAFEDVTVSSGMDQNNNRFSFAAAWCDYDNDGWPDLYVANDFGRKNLYRSNRDGTFSDVAKQAGVEDYGPGMSTCWLDHDNDGQQDLYVANMWLPEGKRITADSQFLIGVEPAIRAIYQKHNAGNSFYSNNGKGGFEDKTVAAGTAMGRWSWSCASWDLDHDGWADLYVANGFVSGPNHFDLQSFFWRQVAQRSMTASGATPEYDLAWNAVNELVRSDYSWSGYQRNVGFVNNRDGTFSEVSGVLGLDVQDDCRAFALSDFDHDGRLEFVLKNRTGPQIKLMRNDMQGIGNSVAFRLTGVASNRDAVGASITIESGAPRQTKFIAIGSGFASQHTKELFFGLGEAHGPISISVQWPNGVTGRYDNIPIAHRVEITEGNQQLKATPFAPLRMPAKAAPLNAPPLPGTITTWLVAPLFGPDLVLPDLNGNQRRLSEFIGKPALLTFVRQECGESLQQLKQLEQEHAALASSAIGLYVVAISDTSKAKEARAWIEAARISIPVHLADEHAAGAWNIQYRYLFDRRRDMILPVSFLIDREGAVIAIYQGVAAPKSVIKDWQTGPSNTKERFRCAMPFNGPYYGGEMKHNYLTYGIAFVEYGYIEEAKNAFLKAVETNPDSEFGWFNLGTIYLGKKMYPEARKYMAEAVRLNPNDSDAWNNLGTISGEEQKYDEALDQFRRAALADPNNLRAVENMMSLYRYQGNAAQAQATLESLIARAPQNSDLHLGLAMTLVAQNDLKGARVELETSIRLKPNNPEALNNLGAVLLRLGLAQEALQRFEQSRSFAPDFDRAVINAALAYSQLGQAAKARQLLTEFLARHPDNADVRNALERMGAA